MNEDRRLGQVVAGCRLDAVLGRGGMGVVYLAEQLHLERRVALKLIASEYAQDAAYRERFVRESRLAAAIDHPNVVPVYEAGEADGLLYLIMRYVEGSDLRALMQRDGPFAPARTVGLIRQMAAALDAAHARGLVHRDVKPANVIVVNEDGAERAYLVDFGLAKRVESGAGPTAGMVGTVPP